MRASGRFCGSYPSSPHARIGASGKCENDMPPSALSPLQTSQSCDGSRGTLSKLRQHVFAGNASLSPIPIPSNVQSVFQGLSTSKSPRLQKWEALTADVLEIQQKQLGASSRTSSKGNSTKDIMSSTGEERGVAFSGTFKLCSTVGRLYEHRESREFRSSLPVVLEEEEEAAERYASSGNLLALQASHQHTKTEDEEWI